MKIDLHVHSSERSACGRATSDEQVRAAIAAGLDAIVFTDHHRLVPPAQLEALNRQYAPFRIYSGIEVTTQGEDFIILGIQDPTLESDRWMYPDLWDFVHQKAGFMALAHPFRYRDHIAVDIQEHIPHAMEVHSANTPAKAIPQIRAIATSLGIPLLSNSDAHSTERLGGCYNILNDPPSSDLDLVAALKAGSFRCKNGCIQAN